MNLDDATQVTDTAAPIDPTDVAAIDHGDSPTGRLASPTRIQL
ncbi:hypothetical protein ABFT23_09530 [Nocardioides sp. C4-1]